MKAITIIFTLFWIIFGIYIISLLPSINTGKQLFSWFLVLILCTTGTFLGCVLFNKLEK